MGVEELKALLHAQTLQFEAWVSAGEFGKVHSAHFDWWQFPLSLESSKGLRYTVYREEIHSLQRDASYMAAYARGAELVCLAWGWDLGGARRVEGSAPSQRWSHWPIRLCKMAQSLELFGLERERASACLFGAQLLAEGEEFSYRGKDLRGPFLQAPPPPLPTALAVFVATVAGGGGDLAFAAAALSALTAGAPSGTRLALALVAQAGRQASELAPALASMLPACQPPPLLLGSFSRGKDNAVTLVVPAAGEDPSGGEPLPPISIVIQGPLHLFDTALEAARALRLPAAGAPRLLTVREFGMQRFLPPPPHAGGGDGGGGARGAGSGSSSSPPPAAAAQQVSAGLGEGEWGLWERPLPLGSSPPALPPLHQDPHWGEAGHRCMGHFRTPSHGRAFGLLVATQVVLGECEGGGSGGGGGGGGGGGERGSPPLCVFAPAESLPAIEEGLLAHPAAQVVVVVQGGGGGGSAAQQRPAGRHFALHWKAAAAGGGGRGCSRRVVLHALSPLPPAVFQALLATSCAACVTGDASANEALALGVPFVYSCEPHKVDFEAGLLAAAGGSAVGAAWNFCRAPSVDSWGALERALGPTANSAAPAAAPASAAFTSASAAPPGCGAGRLSAAFAAWSRSVIKERGSLGAKLCDWAFNSPAIN